MFLDRDGTIGGDGGGVHPLEFTLYENAGKAINLLNVNKFKVFLFTNQSWIGKGKFTEQTFLDGCKKMEKELENDNALLDGIYYCPHKPEDNCKCRKPQTYLLEKAKVDNNLNLYECYIIGDRLSDMISAEGAGAKKILVKTGRGLGALNELSFHNNLKLDYVADDVLTAVEWIVKNVNTEK
ncbi:D-glycero-alpha-D-manno-heptose-1,7-bisphosphate 7-phosphatase [Gracilibacillus oryzae]|uniref:D-glycero-alpha-D-manno-heptose-1,7-bisphosphate 7-phosphatase n=1 Tax=Gracilibacillus oryzae TaxID=1672701 RepID=UPI001D188ABF|nr:HAD-IIIA family hydrolase [Gracilibacillus oryzae]